MVHIVTAVTIGDSSSWFDLPREDRRCPECNAEFTHTCSVRYEGYPAGIAYLPCGHARVYEGVSSGDSRRHTGRLTLAQVTEALLKGE